MYIAKTAPVQETIFEHTSKVIGAGELIQLSYGEAIEGVDAAFWRLLMTSALFHDIGKAYTLFQNRIARYLKLPANKTTLPDIPHNYISVVCVPWQQLQISLEEKVLIMDAIAYHHERDVSPDDELLKRIYQQDLFPRMKDIYKHLQLEQFTPENGLPGSLRNELKRSRSSRYVREDGGEFTPLFRKYVLLKGLLHRADHAASAGVKVESGVDERIGERTSRFLQHNYGAKLRLVQQFAYENRHRHIIVTSSTGSGKTEAALLWADQSKMFFTLPLRASLNAMYKRLVAQDNIQLTSVGLLHSNSYDVLQDKESSEYTEGDSLYELSLQYSCKLTLSTIDQILKFPFYYRGFEKELATMAYSKVVVDEIQAYNPTIAAMLLHAMKLIHMMGGKFMIMTATLPSLYLNKLRDKLNIPAEQLAIAQFPSEILRHRIDIRFMQLEDMIEEIVEQATERKVLVIANTINQAVRLWQQINENYVQGDCGLHLRLLHGRYTQGDRARIEADILDFAESGWEQTQQPKACGIWITTQVVEASVDIDFDMLYSENTALDSLFQRMGRCYRTRAFTAEYANIVIAAHKPSGVGNTETAVYAQDIVELGTNMLLAYQGQLLPEQAKMNMVAELYSEEKLKGTAFLKKFDETYEAFEAIKMFELKKEEAQEKLRDEVSTVAVIPHDLLPNVEPLVEEYKQATSKEERRAIRRQIEQYTVIVRLSFLQQMLKGKPTNSTKNQPISNYVNSCKLREKGLDYLYVIPQGLSKYDGNGAGLTIADDAWIID